MFSSSYCAFDENLKNASCTNKIINLWKRFASRALYAVMFAVANGFQSERALVSSINKLFSSFFKWFLIFCSRQTCWRDNILAYFEVPDVPFLSCVFRFAVRTWTVSAFLCSPVVCRPRITKGCGFFFESRRYPFGNVLLDHLPRMWRHDSEDKRKRSARLDSLERRWIVRHITVSWAADERNVTWRNHADWSSWKMPLDCGRDRLISVNLVFFLYGVLF